jgi:hypothetical protein
MRGVRREKQETTYLINIPPFTLSTCPVMLRRFAGVSEVKPSGSLQPKS